MAKGVSSCSQRRLAKPVLTVNNAERHFSLPSLLTRQSTLVLKVGVS